MKRRILFTAVLTFSVVTAFSQSYYNKTIVIEKPDVSGLKDILGKTERDSIESGIKANLEENFSKYVQMQTAGDEEEARRTMEIQARESESNAYDNSTGPEIGSFARSFYALQTKVLRQNKQFQLSVTFRDLTTNIGQTVTSRRAYSKEELYSHPGAADDITILICERLGIQLSSIDRMVLQKGYNNLDTDHQIESSKAQLEVIARQMAELQAQSKAAAAEPDAKIQQMKIAARMEDLKLRKQQEQDRAARLQRDKERREQEHQNDLARNEEQRSRIEKEAREAEKSAAEIRAKRIETASLYSRFRILEDKKQNLLELEKEKNTRIEEIQNKYAKEISDTTAEIMGRRYRASDMSGGKPIPEALRERQKEAKDAEEELSYEMNKNIAEVKTVYQKQLDAIAGEIVDDYDDLEFRPFTASSINNPDDLVYVIEDFDRKLMGWPISFYYYSDGINIGNFKSVIPYQALYKALEKKDAPLPSTDKNAFDDAVDRYQSHLANKTKIINFVLNFESKAVLNTPSRYATSFKKLEMYATTTGKKFLTQTKFDNSEKGFGPDWWYTFNSNPQNVKKFVSSEIERRKKFRLQEEARQRAEEEAARKAEKEARKAEERRLAKIRFAENQKGRKGVFIDVGHGSDDFMHGVNIDISALFGSKYLFFGGLAEYNIGLPDGGDNGGVTYIIAENNSGYKTLNKINSMRFLGVAGATIGLGWFRPYVMTGAGYYSRMYTADSVIYREDPRYGTGGIIASGATVLAGLGADFGSGNLKIGANLKAFIDMGASTWTEYSLCIGYKFW